MRLRRRLRTIALLAGLTAAASTSPRRACAQDTDATSVAAARDHFEKARTFYAQGAYREAVAELEAAHALDPSAKDLVFNLGVVHEKLADIDEALQWFQLYTTMNLTAQERERADAYIKRLAGAKREVPPPPENPAALSAGNQPEPEVPPAHTESPRHGRVDAATIAFAGISGGFLVLSTAIGIKALIDRPPRSGPVLGQDLSPADLNHRVNLAHDEAVAADVGFGVSIVAGVAAAILYFGRPKDAASPGTPRVSVAPLPGGGALVVQGSM